MNGSQLVMLAFQVSIVCTVFAFGLKATLNDLLFLLRQPSLLCRSLLSVLVVVPALAVLLVRAFDFRHTFEVALIALAVSPVPPLLPKKEGKAGGQRAFGLGLMVILALLAIVSVPLAVEVLERVFAVPLNASAAAIARVVLMMVLLPFVAGMAVHAAAPPIADRLEKLVDPLAKTLMPVAILGLFAGTWRGIWQAATGDGTVITLVAFVAASLLVGHLLGGPELEHSVVLALSSACRHPAIALSIAATNFPDEHFGGTILLYLIVNTIVALPYLAWCRKRLRAAASV